MRYVEDKEHSARILRLVLAQMTRHQASYHPVNYALWYEHVGGLNAPLSAALGARLQRNEPLTDDEIYHLHNHYIQGRGAALLDGLQRRLGALLDDTARTARIAGDDTGRFVRALGQTRRQMTELGDGPDLRELLGVLLDEVSRMEANTALLSGKLEARADEVRKLTSELVRAQSEAFIDPLCAISNRRGFERVVNGMIGTDAGLAGSALVLADVDRFKRVNDTFGHMFGDQVLRSIADVLRANVKGRDVVARIGGEEFALLLPDTTANGARQLAEQIRMAVVREHIQIDTDTDTGSEDESTGLVTLSLGVAAALPAEAFQDLMARADAALYAAKHSGRNCVCLA